MDFSVTGKNSASSGPLTPSDLSAKSNENIDNLKVQDNFVMYGVGEVQIQPSGTQTSPAVQEAWSEQMAEITSVMDKIATGSVEPQDLNRLVAALKELANLATNGITDEQGTNYITQDMAQALNAMLFQFAQVGITPTMDLNSLSDAQKVTLLNNANSEKLQEVVKSASSYTNEDLGLQSYVYTEILGLINSQAGVLSDLQEYLGVTKETLDTLGDLIDISGYTDAPEPWLYDMELNDPGDIPPGSVDEIQTYIEENDGNGSEKEFQATYEREYAEAEKRAEQNGTTVQYEMSQTENYPPYTVNGVRTSEKTSSELLGHFLGNKGDEERFNAIEAIFIETTVQELNNVPTLPEGSTWTEVSEDIWNAKTSLENQIQTLKDQDADPDMIDSLQTIVDSIDDAWADAKSANGIPADKTFEEVAASTDSNSLQAMEDFATSFIEDTQPGQDGANDLNVAVRNFENWNQELQKEFEKVMQMLDMFIKALSQMLKQMSDVNKNYAKNM